MTVVLSDQLKQRIDDWATRYPKANRQSAVIEALRMTQIEQGGWLSADAMDAVAAHLSMPPIAVYEVATFYDMFELVPVGRHIISICTNVSCMLVGVEALVKHLEKRLEIKVGHTTADRAITLKEVECMGACCGAPMCQIDNEHYHENLTPSRMDFIIDCLRRDHVPMPQEVIDAS